MSYRRPEYVSQRRPDDVLKTSLYGSISKTEKRWRDENSVFGLGINEYYTTSMNIYYSGLLSAAAWQYKRKEYELRVLIEKQDAYISFIKSFINFYLSFINLINFSHQNCLTLQKNWFNIKRKNIFHQHRRQDNANLAYFNTITTLSLVRMLYEEQNTQWKHYISVLKLCKVYNAV